MKSTLVVMATGTGKTVVMADLVRRWRKGRVMMIAHREELITQGADKFSRLCGEKVGIEMADSVVREWNADRPRVVVASVQTLNAGNRTPRMEKFDPSEFSLILTDEAHRATAASYRRIYNWFSQNPKCRHLGVTATPDRTDQRALGTVFDSVAFKYDILTAITDGWLVPVQQEFVQVSGLDLSACHANKIDLKDNDVAEVMERDENLFAVCDSTRRLAAGRKTIVFAASVAHAHRMAQIFNGYEESSAAAIDGKTDKDLRRNILRRFAAGELRYVVNMGCLTEGFDDPSIEVVAMARPTKSRLMYAQMLGRGTRPLEGIVDGLIDPVARQSAIAGSSKPVCTVLDFVGNSGKHKLVCSADILGGEEPPEVMERMRRNAKARNKPADMMEELEIARSEIKEEKRKAEEKRLTPEARFHSTSVDPFNHYDVVHQQALGGNSDYSYLEKQGVNKKWLARATRDQVQAVVRQVKHRHAAGLCTVKQVNVLRRAGINGHSLTKRQAGELLDPIFKNNFRAPSSVIEKAREWGCLIGK
jgi:superfamily II DNA or RNA helicase